MLRCPNTPEDWVGNPRHPHLASPRRRPRWTLATILILLLCGAPGAGAVVNDTGIDWWADGATHYLTSEPPGYPGQDASQGRDRFQDNDSDGHAGFSFTKLDANGAALPAGATTWSCVRDNVTGLIWEVKTNDGGLHDRDDSYNWYDTNPETNGGFVGYANDDGAICTGYDANNETTWCNTQAFVARVNAAGWCGAKDWRLPTLDELRGIVDYSRYDPAIDTNYFPNTQSSLYWSASPYASNSGYAWYVYFSYGGDGYYNKDYYVHVRLVRGGQALPSDSPTLEFDPIPPIQTEAQPFPVTITARDAQGGVVKLNETAEISTPAGDISTSRLITLIDGTWSGQVTVYGAGVGVTLRAYASYAKGVSGMSQPFTLNALSAEPVALYGSVVDHHDNPLSGADVYLSSFMSGLEDYHVVTDDYGRYAFTGVGPSEYSLWAAYGSDPRRESDRVQHLWMDNRGARTWKKLMINSFTDQTPVLLVPGILGSTLNEDSGFIPLMPKDPAQWENQDLKLFDPKAFAPFVEWDPIGVAGWEKLRAELRARGYSDDVIIAVPYDWRASVGAVASEFLKKAIDAAKAKFGSPKVDIVAHSTGGLVARAYIQSNAYENDVRKLAMVGTPHQGAVNAYYIWSGGDPLWADDLNGNGFWYENFYSNSIQELYETTYGLGPLWTGQHYKIYEFLHSAQKGRNPVGAELRDLLPTFTFLSSDGSPDKGLVSDDNRNETLIALNSDPERYQRMTPDGANGTVQAAVFYGHEISGGENTTIRRHEVSWLLNVFPLIILPRWADGMPSSGVDPERDLGDGTVLDISSRLPCYEGWAACPDPDGPSGTTHGMLIGAAKTAIAEFLSPAASAPTVMPQMAAPQLEAVATRSQLALNLDGRVRPYLRTPRGEASGVDPATGALVEGIPGAEVSLGGQNGSILVGDPADGLYEVSIRGPGAEDVLVRLSYVGEDGSAERRVRLFHAGGVSSFGFRLDGAAADRLTTTHLPAPPVDLRADAVEGGGLTTRLAWLPGPTSGVSGYQVYGRRSDDPFLIPLGSTSATSFDTGDPWGGVDDAALRIYAVSAVLPDGSESFLSDLVENNDRDHDGLRDGDEAQLGTNPELPDTDADGLTDGEELSLGTHPLEADTDGDGAPDAQDAFPLDPSESVDTDGDGIGNNADPDDDNDGRNDGVDNCPLVANPGQGNADGDGLGDACDSVQNGCQAGPVILSGITFGAGAHTLKSGQSITSQGQVQLLSTAQVSLSAPYHRFGSGLRVNAGARLQVKAEPVTCTAGGTSPMQTAGTLAPPADQRVEAAAAPLVAPRPFGPREGVPDDLHALLAGRGIDITGIDQALFDAQGQWLVFETSQSLTRADGNDTSDIYRLDLLTETLSLLSRTPWGTAGHGPSRYPAADASGELVMFQSDAADLVAGDDNNVTDIFLHELPLGETIRITTTAPGASAHPALDAAGEDLLYDQQTEAGHRQVLLNGLWGDKAPEPISLAADSAGLLLDNHHPAISADGRFVAYLEVLAPAADQPGCLVHLYDRDSGRYRREPCPEALAAGPETARPYFSADGTQVEWYLPDAVAPVVVPNPLLAVPEGGAP